MVAPPCCHCDPVQTAGKSQLSLSCQRSARTQLLISVSTANMIELPLCWQLNRLLLSFLPALELELEQGFVAVMEVLCY